MKTLHVGNVAGTATQLKKSKDRILMNNTNPFNYPCDYNYQIGGNNKLSSILSFAKTLYRELQSDKIHSHARSIPCCIDLIVSKVVGKEIIIHYHGSDIRNKKQPFIHRLISNTFYVSTPDLLKHVPGATWYPNPFNISKELPDYHKHKPIKILHAPSNKNTKGTSCVINSINKLESEGFDIDFILIEKAPHETVLQHIKDCDIVLDQFIIGWYGVLACEAMDAGKPVLCYIDYENTPMNIKIPIINTTCDDLYDTLKHVILLSEGELKKIGIEGREYLKTIHVRGD